jgi:hypothetical protein
VRINVDSLADALGTSTTIAVFIVILAVVQIAVQIFDLIDLARRRYVTGGKKWVWLLVILFGNLVGAILYLAIGRQEPPAIEPDLSDVGGASPSERARAAADVLYGQDERQ